MKSRLLLVALQVAYLAWMIVFGRFLSGDEIAYKAAGREWAQSGHFVAPELLGFGSWRDPAHPYELRRGFGPPVYTFSFGLFVKVSGFTPRTNAAFDALIHILLGWATFALARAIAPQLPLALASVVAAATLPLGTAGRPDELGTVFAMFGAALLLRRATVGRAVGAGILYGLSAGTSLVAAGILLVWPLRAMLIERARAWRMGAAFCLSAGGVFLLTMLPLYLADPYGLTQLTHLAGESARTSYAWAIANSLRYGLAHYLAAAAALVISAAQLLRGPRSGWLALWLPPLVALAALLLVLPVKYYYVWMVVPSLFAAAACALAVLQWGPLLRTAVLGAALVLWCAAASRFFLMALVRATLPADQRMSANVALLRRTIPEGAGIMTYDFWPALAGSARMYSLEADPPWKDVDYIVLTGNGSGTPGQAQALRPEQVAYVRDHFAPVLDHLNRQPFSFGPIHTHSAWGYGPRILKRINRAD